MSDSYDLFSPDKLPSPHSAMLREILEGMVRNKATFDQMRPHFRPADKNVPKDKGGVCGHKVMDLKAAVDIIRRCDKENLLSPFKMDDNRLGIALKNAVRTYYTLDKNWKIISYSPKINELLLANAHNPTE